MVDKIPECGHTAVHGLQGELAALHSKQDPLEQLMDNMRQTLEATKDILIQSRDNKDTGQTDLGKISEIVNSQSKALSLCKEVTDKQHLELMTKFSQRNRDFASLSSNLTLDRENCEQYCQQSSASPVETGSDRSNPTVKSNPIRIKPEQCSCGEDGCHAYVSLQQCGDRIDVLSCNLSACQQFISRDNCKQFL